MKTGDSVVLQVNIAGIVTCERRIVGTVDERGIWLDNGPGNRPSGPYNPTTRQWADNGVIPGSSQRLMVKAAAGAAHRSSLSEPGRVFSLLHPARQRGDR